MKTDDSKIIDLFWERDETAISETAEKYGSYLRSISYRILNNTYDAEECVNDTYRDAWRVIPPNRPAVLSTFLGKITRRISIDLWRKNNAEKRGGGEMPVALDELGECISDRGSISDEAEYHALTGIINDFLRSLPETEQKVFLRRYWYLDPVSSIAKRFGFSESKVTSMLFRVRGKLRTRLEKEGY